MKRVVLAAVCVGLWLLAAVLGRETPSAQQPTPPIAQELSLDQQKALVAEHYKGVTRDGRIIPGLTSIKRTGISTALMRGAAEALLDSLTAEQRAKTTFPVDDPEWRLWDNRPDPPSAPRQGIGFAEMSGAQRDLAFEMLRASLSTNGFQQTQDIMKLNETLADMTNDHNRFGQWKYWITIMGTPSETEPWGWQLDGHHCIINYFVLGDQVVMTPTFMAAEPVRAATGRFAGTVVLQAEQDKGAAWFNALSATQQNKARIAGAKTANNTIAAAYQDNLVLDYAGIRATELQQSQRETLLSLIAEHLDNLPEPRERLKMDEVRAHVDDTYFGWIGNAAPGGVFYYRVQSPVVLIEFDHQAPARGVPGPPGPYRDHIHTVVRTPNGNDYGKDLLRLHYQAVKH
jgi:Protein of unknown function (DUF3500)